MNQPLEPDTIVATGCELGHQACRSVVMRTSRFDRVTSFLAALMAMVGLGTGVLVLMWIVSGSESTARHPSVSEYTIRTAAWERGAEASFVEPVSAEVVELAEPTVEDQLAAVSDEVSRVSGTPNPADFLVGVSSTDAEGVRASDGAAERTAGPPANDSSGGAVGGDHAMPRFERWRLDFRARELDGYARQLDRLGIELGLIGGGLPEVDYVRDVSAAEPTRRQGQSEHERRLYFLWNQPGPLMDFDRQLLRRAGAPIQNRHILKFIPVRLEERLAALELEHAIRHGIDSVAAIKRTVFTLRSFDEGSGFLVSEQTYRSEPPER